MAVTQEILDTFRKITALEYRTQDIREQLIRVESKLDNLIDRLSRIEANYQNLRENLRSQILGDLKAEMVKFQIEMEKLQFQNNKKNSQAARKKLKK
jgi:predicted nuclease with TOPRIM domain